MKKLIFFVIASAILFFSIIVVNIAPAINGLVSKRTWSEASCSKISDEINYAEEHKTLTEDQLKYKKRERNRCNNKKAMVGLEHVVSNLNIIFGAICSLLGFLHFINVGNMGKIIGLIGLGVGGISFVLTLVYVIESGLVFNDIVNYSNMRIDSDGAYLEYKDNKYVCIYYDEDDKESVYLRYSDYGKKYLSYHKDLTTYREGDKEFMFKPIDYGGCIYDVTSSSSINKQFEYTWPNCKTMKDSTSPVTKIEYRDTSNHKKGDCDKIYLVSQVSDNTKKVLYDRWLTTIIFSCFIFLLNIGLAIFGFLLFRESSGSSGSVAIK